MPRQVDELVGRHAFAAREGAELRQLGLLVDVVEAAISFGKAPIGLRGILWIPRGFISHPRNVARQP